MASSTRETKILPSPILPVRAAVMMAWMARSAISSETNDFELDLRQQVDGVFAPAIELGVAFLAAVAARFEHGDALDAGLDERVLDLIELGRLE